MSIGQVKRWLHFTLLRPGTGAVHYFLSPCSSRESFNSVATQMINAGPKQTNTPIGITQILINLSIAL